MRLETILGWLDETGIAYRFQGDKACEISGFASLENAGSGMITWVKKRENYEKLTDHSGIECAVVQEGLELEIPNQVISPASKEVFFSILHHFWGQERREGFIGEGTIIAEGAEVDPTACIGYHCTIIGPVRIGAHTVIENDVVIQGKVCIGDRCHIQSQSVIGIDGFGYSKNPDTGKKIMVEHFGGVSIGNDVFIASHVNIARGTIDDTVIEDGVRIAPTTHIGHNNRIGKNATVICSNLFGSVRTGEEAYIVASTVQNQSQVGEHTVIGMGSVVTKPIPDHVVAFGIPAAVVKNNDTEY